MTFALQMSLHKQKVSNDSVISLCYVVISFFFTKISIPKIEVFSCLFFVVLFTFLL